MHIGLASPRTYLAQHELVGTITNTFQLQLCLSVLPDMSLLRSVG